MDDMIAAAFELGGDGGLAGAGAAFDEIVADGHATLVLQFAQPPSTVNCCAEIMALSSDARNSAMRAMSSG